MNRVLIVCPYPVDAAPSERFRFGQYVGDLERGGHRVTIRSFWSARAWRRIYEPGRVVAKAVATTSGFVSRFFLLLILGRYDVVLVHREATPIGPPWWEWLAVRVFGAKLVYDFDDAIWLPNSSEANAGWVGKFKHHGKVDTILKLSATVFVGNTFLAEYARGHAADVRVVPTTIDTGYHRRPDDDVHRSRHANGEPLTVGWTGSHSTLRQLVPLFPVLARLHQTHPFRLLVIADRAPDDLPPFAEFRRWRRETEIQDILHMDIGVMPLYDTQWERGKCGFKALQYLALEIPAVVSAVGVNTDIVRDGVDGFWAEPMPAPDGEQWLNRLRQLLGDAELRATMGRAGRARVERHYSVMAHRQTYLEVLGGDAAARSRSTVSSNTRE